jgi:hypothetical protein
MVPLFQLVRITCRPLNRSAAQAIKAQSLQGCLASLNGAGRVLREANAPPVSFRRTLIQTGTDSDCFRITEAER